MSFYQKLEERVFVDIGKSYSIAQHLNKSLIIENVAAISLSMKAWRHHNGDLEFKREGRVLFLVLSNLSIDTYTYQFTGTTDLRGKETKFLDLEKKIILNNPTTVLIAMPSVFEELTKKFTTRENLFKIIIAVLIGILIGVLKDSIKELIEKILDGLGKYSKGKLAERRFLKRYIDNIIFNHQYLKLVGFNTAGISRPRLEEIFVSLRVSKHNIGSDRSGETSSIQFTSAIKQFKNLVILGGPGAGKTTILSYSLLMFAQNRAEPIFDIQEKLLPLFIPLRRLSANNQSILDDMMSADSQIISGEL